jgi:hypothetical protein
VGEEPLQEKAAAQAEAQQGEGAPEKMSGPISTDMAVM